jgi:hypothetical protein
MSLVFLGSRADNFTAICGAHNISQPHRPPRPVTGLASLSFYLPNAGVDRCCYSLRRCPQLHVWQNYCYSTHIDKWLDYDLQRTDPASCQRGRPTEIRQQISDPNTEKEVISGQTSTGLDTKTYWLTVSRKVTLTLTLTRIKARDDWRGKTSDLYSREASLWYRPARNLSWVSFPR